MVIKPFPINKKYHEVLHPKLTSQEVELTRMSIKPADAKYVLNKNEIAHIIELREELESALLKKKSVETIYRICQAISSLNHDFPPQYLENLTQYLRENMSTAEDTSDYYSFNHIADSCEMIKMNRRDFESRVITVQHKTDSFAQSLSRLLNFQVPETQMNAVLDELVDHAIKRCYRGPGVDILFYLKHKRDL